MPPTRISNYNRQMIPSCPDTLPTLTILPVSLLSRGRNGCVTLTASWRFTCKVRSKSSILTSSTTLLSPVTPALITKAARRLLFSSKYRLMNYAAATTWSSFVTSINRDKRFGFLWSRIKSASFSLRTHANTTNSFAKNMAACWPIPLEAPSWRVGSVVHFQS